MVWAWHPESRALPSRSAATQQANEQFQKGEITQEQYDALQREPQETEQKLKSLEAQAGSTNTTLAKIEEVGGKMEKVGNSFPQCQVTNSILFLGS